MRIDAFLQQSPMFAVHSTARHFNSLAESALAADQLNFMEALVLAAIFFEAPRQIKPSQLAETFATTRGNISHGISSLEAKGLLQRRIDPADARGYLLTLTSPGKKSAMRVIRALDRLQQSFEKHIGKSALSETLHVLKTLQTIVAPNSRS